MKIFLLGNGFDLYHKLPTSYANFLHVVNFLKDNYNSNLDTIGKVFGNKILTDVDPQIKEIYTLRKSAYDCIKLDTEKIKFISDSAKSNLWFTYLLKSFDIEVGWIDFEKEIANVLDVFYDFFTLDSTEYNWEFHIKEEVAKHILKHFNFFYCDNQKTIKINETAYIGTNIGDFTIKPEYSIEVPFGSGKIEINKNKIIEALYNELIILADMLKTYLECFVDKTIDTLIEKNKINTHPMFRDADKVVSFNYTNTAEKLYERTGITYIHGSTSNNIVLGINPDKYDELENIDTSFSVFKKYHQRILYQTDFSYRNLIKSIHQYKRDLISLYVVGHSLDETDSDVIMELFSAVDQINIYYHRISALGKHIDNLVSIYGKKNFDNIRFEKNMQFIQLK